MYNANELPKIKEGTSGIALPMPGASVAACAVPADTEMSTPWGQVLSAKAGRHYHICLDAEKGDHYPNDEFETFYQVIRQLNPDEDPRAKFLAKYWASRGYPGMEVYEAEKTKPVKVVGVLDEAGEFENIEGVAPFEPGDVLLESPDISGRMWVMKSSAFQKKYQGIR